MKFCRELILLIGVLTAAEASVLWEVFRPDRGGDMMKNISARFYNGLTLSDYIDTPLDRLGSLVDNPTFSVSRRTVMYLHGFTEKLSELSVMTVMGAYVAARKDVNLIAIDWSTYAAGDYAFVLLANCISVAKSITKGIDFLMTKGLQLDRLHLIGHSMGGQLAGLIGKNLQRKHHKKPARITALDPAGPGFTPFLPWFRLDTGDADIIDHIQTNPQMYGYPQNAGTVLFSFNPNVTFQPGCPEAEFQTPESYCSHHRSWRFWAESLSRPDAFIGFNGDDQAIMGDNFNGSKRGEYKMKTGSASPFGLGIAGRP